MAEDILYSNDNGVEFWTVQETGESATSERGLSKMSGIPQKTLNRWLLDLSHEAVPNRLKAFQDKPFTLSHEIKRSHRKIKPIKSEFATAVILYSAIELKKTAAILSLAAFAHIGLESYIQAKTGWLPKEKQSAKRSRSLIDCILSDPKIWTMHFKPQWREDACRVTGYHWHPSRPMAQFISTYIYKALPSDVYQRLMDVNADRKARHHQFFDDVADEVILKEHIQQVGGLLRVSRNKPHFKQLFSDAFGDGIQGEIDL